MYTVTFYSFKGGLGRTMAMANIALSLAQSGSRVLLVDFDLEAPGLDTFDLLRPAKPTPGLVDFVVDYRRTGISPDVSEFTYELSDLRFAGHAWVMPSGGQDDGYGSKLSSIDWRQLYAEENGYLLFEDLKEQWAKTLKPDYVFIDSRTGHTDVGGICTRQLPDAVVLLFFPNEQNRRGMEVVVRDINLEHRETGRAIEKYFVASNVPDLDDDENILRDELAKFQSIMDRASPHATIHHYDSLLLLQQTIFTIERPKTKLASEYALLAKTITSSNLADRAVVTKLLEDIEHGMIAPDTADDRLKNIRSFYKNDGLILFSLAQANRSIGRASEAKQLFAEAAKLGFVAAEQLVHESETLYAQGKPDSARDTVRRALRQETKRVFALERLCSTVVANDIEFLSEILHTSSLDGLDAREKLYIATRLEVTKQALAAVADFLQPLVASGDENARSERVLCLIGQGKFSEAIQLILANGRRHVDDLSVQDSFNYAMAVWGEKKAPPGELFERVVKLDLDRARPAGANYYQCIAIANWAVGRVEVARDFAAKSRLADESELEFSAWRYLRLNKEQFLLDLDSLDNLINTGLGWPQVLGQD